MRCYTDVTHTPAYIVETFFMLPAISVLRLYNIDDRINEYRAVSEMKIGRGNQSTRKEAAQSHFVHQEAHIT
jgi:hypothetical protein